MNNSGVQAASPVSWGVRFAAKLVPHGPAHAVPSPLLNAAHAAGFGRPAGSAGTGAASRSVRPESTGVIRTVAPVGHTRARQRPGIVGIVNARSLQSSTWTNTVSPRRVVTPQPRGAMGPARVP